MRAIRHLYVLLLLALMLGCASGPKNDTERVYVAQQSLIVAKAGVVEAHDAGKLVGEDYEKAKALIHGGERVYRDARDAAMLGDHDSVVTYLTVLNATLNEVALYNGGKR